MVIIKKKGQDLTNCLKRFIALESNFTITGKTRERAYVKCLKRIFHFEHGLCYTIRYWKLATSSRDLFF